MKDDKKRTFRSAGWFARTDKDGFIHRSWMRGYPQDVFDGRPVIGICNTWSELTPCNAHFRTLADHVKRGVWEAGGFPVEFPVMSSGETNLRPTAMLFRNLISMDVEESIRANPIDGVVLLCGCDKTTPGLVMGAASVDLPSIVLSGGPMLNGKFCGQDIGSGTDVWRFSEDVRAGRMSLESFMEAQTGMSRSTGTCMVMGTASTMASMVEALGISLPHNAAIPAVDSRRQIMAQLTGRRIVEMVAEDLRPSKILTRKAFENGVRANAALGGSTNAVIHLLALARRAGIPLTIDEFDPVAQKIPALTNVLPSGKYLMEDFYFAGGLPALMQRLRDQLDLSVPTVTGQSLADNIAGAKVNLDDVIRSVDDPISSEPGLAVLRGNLAPNGCVIKPSAAEKRLLQHEGKAVVFENIRDLNARIDDPALDVDENSVLVLKMGGPEGAPGMPEWGGLPIPKKLLEKGVRDMVRISDARMSGTHYGACILHVSPEAAVGGPLAFVKDGDTIRLDVAARRLDLVIDDQELSARRAAWVPPQAPPQSGYVELFRGRVLQAHEGCDFVGFGRRGIPEPEIF
jgi:dihydroxy-acid dehydratase